MTRSKITLLVASIGFALVFMAKVPEADARPRPAGGTSDFRANKEFGLGLVFGNPNGLAGKYYLSDDTALDFAVGYSRYYVGRRDRRGGLHVHGSFLWHPAVLAQPDPFWLPIYFGVGGRFLDREYFYDRDRRSRFGVRVPVGLMMDFNDVPLDIFFEIAPIFDFLTPSGRGWFGFHSALGARYYFN